MTEPAPVSDVTSEEVFDVASEEGKKLALELLPKVTEIVREYLEGKNWPVIDKTPPNSLDAALDQAGKLDAKLVTEIERRKEAEDLLRSAVQKAIGLAVKLAIVGLV